MSVITHSLCVSDDPKTFENAPISVQLVGRTLEEEAVIGMGEIVDAALKAYIQFQANAKL